MTYYFPMGCAITDGNLGLGATAAEEARKQEIAAEIIAAQNKAAAANVIAASQTPEAIAARKALERQAGISKAASLINALRGGSSSATPYSPPASSLPPWLLPVGIGAAALTLFLVLRK